MHSGILPPKLLELISSICILVELVNEQRKFMSPCCPLPRVFPPILNRCSCLICAKEGISPAKLLREISKKRRFEALDIDLGICPVK